MVHRYSKRARASSR